MALAASLGMPLVSKDVIKETLFDVLGDVADDGLDSSCERSRWTRLAEFQEPFGFGPVIEVDTTRPVDVAAVAVVVRAALGTGAPAVPAQAEQLPRAGDLTPWVYVYRHGHPFPERHVG